MPIQLIENFELSVPKPIDNRIVVGPGFTYTDKNSIPLPYVGMRIFDTNDSYPYLWTGSTWSFETNRVNVTHNITSNSDHFINFVSATGSPQLLQSNQTLRFHPLRGQITAGPGSAIYPTYGFTSSNSSQFMGMWKVSSNIIGFSISRISGTDFQISSTGITASQRFNVANDIPGSFTFGQGTARFGRLTGTTFPSIEFYATSPNTALRVYNLSPVNIEATRSGGLPGYSNATTATTGLSLENWTNYSVLAVRDQHYINTESRRGILSIGNAGNNDQFVFFMRDHSIASSNSSFDYDGGGLIIQRNLSVSGGTRLSGTVSVLSNVTISKDVAGDYYGLAIKNSSTAATSTKTSILSFWGKSTTGVDQRVVDIYAQCRPLSGPINIGEWAKSSLVFQVIPRDSSGSTINIGGVSGWNAHTIELREDGQVYMGPNVGSGAAPTTIIGSSPLFPNSLPRLDIATGLSSGAYNDCIVFRQPAISVSAVTRRIGLLMKLSGESNSTESLKSGGMMVESSEGAANFPSLFLVTSDEKRLEIDATQYGGNFIFNNPTNSIFNGSTAKIPGKKVIISNNDIITDIHNKGTNGIGDSGNQVSPWAYPSIASGQLSVPDVIYDSVNISLSSLQIKPLIWMRVGNVVSVSGSVRINISVANAITEFKLPLPLLSNFGFGAGNANNWQLNGIGKTVDKFGSATSPSGDVVTIQAYGSPGFAHFKFKASSTGVQTIVYNYQYVMGNYPNGAVPDPPSPTD
jgi:hypothetical protein